MNRKRYFVFSLSAITIIVCYLFLYSDAVRVLITEIVRQSLTTSEEIYFRSAKINSIYRKHEGYKYFRFVKKLDDVELSSNFVEGSDSVLVIVDDRYKLPDCDHLVSLPADAFSFVFTDSEESISFVVSCVAKDSLYRYRLKKE
ncbi:hypothetical protein [Bacteroides hominis]|uniref:hypothetical protein n=1 Tax=Bacteroides hominis TaxID=2763023 RepID=UPI00294A6626|nr:hypothetical protein [Bacteroides hominis (ex Liu et al. 2022)]MDV6195608.1 hypothetical protein [Bacteroides hominis (ex Liu et al. 2022)]